MTRITRNTCLFLLIAFSLLLAGVAGLARLNQKEVRDSLALDSRWIRDDIESLLRRYEHGLRGTRGAILAIGADDLSREKLLRYMDSRDLAQEFPWAGGFGFIRHVPLAALPAYEKKMREDRLLFSGITQLADNPGDRYVIEYIEPLAPNRPALGLDIASSPERRSAADHAMLTGRAELTTPIRLVQKEGRTANAYLFLLPIYAGSVTPPTMEQRQERILGWAYAPLSVHDILSELSRRWNMHSLEILVEDVASNTTAVELFRSGGFDQIEDAVSLQTAVPLYGRAWKLSIRAAPEYAQAHQFISDRATLLSCITLAMLILASALAYQVFSTRERKLQEARALLAAVVDSSPDAIVTTDARGLITSWNRGASDTLGLPEGRALGTALSTHAALRELDQQGSTRSTSPGFSAGTGQQEEAHVISLQGESIRYASALMFPLRDGAGRQIGKAFMLRDVTREKRIERQLHRINEELELTVQQRTHALHQAKTMLQTVLNVMPSLVGYWDKHLINRFANASYERVFGREHGEITGMYMLDLVGTELFESAMPHIDAVLAGEKQTFERTFTDAVNGYKHVLTTYIPDVNEQGEVNGFYVVAHDVTEITHNRNQLSEALAQNQSLLDQVQQSNALLNNVLSSATGVAIIATAPDGVITLFNRGAERMLGYRAEDVIGQMKEETFSGRLNHPAIRAHATLDEKAVSDLRYRRKDGVTLPVTRQQTSMLDHRQRHIGDLYIAMDMSLQRQQEAELAATRDQLMLAAEVAKLGVWVWDRTGDTFEFNRQIAEIYGIGDGRSGQVTTYEGWRRRVHPDDVGYVESALQAALAGTGEFEPVFRVVRADGSIRFVQARAHVDRNGMGAPVRVIGINLDITQRIEFENNLVEARLKAEQANSAKSLFLASVSHEIRTPMNGVLGMIQLLQRTQPQPAQRDYLNKAEISAKSLLNLLNDLLDFSKMDAQQVQLDLQAFSLEHFRHDLTAILAGNPPQEGVSLHIELDGDLPQRVVGDVYRLQQVLVNLISNALKFTHLGRIDVALRRLAADNTRQVMLRVEVSDTGIGIAPERLKDIFDAFTQAEASTTRRYGGTGLGLAISRHLVQLMGGQLQVSSEPGRGSRFWFDLPMEIEDATPLSQARAADEHTQAEHAPAGETARELEGVQILLVEDNAVNRQVATGLLSLYGAHISCAENGSTGVAMACDPERHYDLILMDLQMPGIDGIEATRRIRRQQDLRHIPILAMTANASPEDRRRCIAAGMAGHIAKPIDVSTLVPTLLSHLQHDRNIAAQETLPAEATRVDVQPADRQQVDVYADLMRRYRQASDVYRTTLDAAGPELERLFADYDAVLAQASPGGIEQAAHALKGLCATIGASGLAAYFAGIERVCRAGEGVPSDRLFPAWREELGAVRRDAGVVLQQLAMQALQGVSGSPGPAAPQAVAEPATATAEASDFPDRQALRALLLSSNLEALDLAEAIGKRHGLMQQTRYQQLWELIEKLDFPAALAYLDDHFGEPR
ncbi:CHASE domain-containing protein [Herbaspirillum huttiense]|uniref:CHASE domain-containing protein n=1 Tax=Herbaspirillum huttiense TaxID=863372 RepID=UPI002E7A023B|nr:CHASE domain-containing protein [Herbaspirillum huttiense]MEE1637627.1 CHASE domain-containing protein [Herbaspirillum huttiense NC40101]